MKNVHSELGDEDKISLNMDEIRAFLEEFPKRNERNDKEYINCVVADDTVEELEKIKNIVVSNRLQE
jgi:hypothetical protein